jgi:non-specific serine/threonine protein kinase
VSFDHAHTLVRAGVALVAAGERQLGIESRADVYRTARTLDARPLTAREGEVAALVARGFTNRQIAELLVISRRTSENHVAHVCNKLGFTSRAQIAAWAVEHELTTGALLAPPAGR